MKVLIVHPHMSFYGGAELVIVNFSNYLTRNGIENKILTLSGLDEVKKDLIEDNIINLKGRKENKKSLFKFLNFLNEILILRKYVNEHGKEYDIINVHNFPAEYSVFPSVKNCVWMCNEPPIQFYLNKPKSLLFKIFGSLLIKFDKFLVKNYIKYSVVADDFNYKRFEKIYDIKPEIINYGIDYEFFSNGNGEKVKKIYNLKNKFVLLQTGTLTPLKNQMESIKVVEKLKDKIPNIKLVLVGWGEENYEKMLKDYVKEHKLEDNVIFTGHLKREVIRNLNDACDVALFPMKSQGGWLSPFEVLCAGKPIIVSSFTTSSDIIKKNVLGIVTDDFSKAVLDVYKNKAKYKKISERGKKWVEENLTWDNFSGKMLEVFDKVIE